MNVLVIIPLLACPAFLVAQRLHPDVLLNLEQRINRHGYPVEIHQVTTQDEYILNIYRIPHGLNKSKHDSRNKSPVIFVHGQGGSPHNFVALGRGTAAAYYFADRNFDVWLFCARGVDCQNPRKHQKLDWNRDTIYWNFSLHEIAIYDLTASIDYILRKTNKKKIFYVGHDTGGSQFYALMSERPEYNDKIKINVNYAPIMIQKEIDYPYLQLIYQFSNAFKNIYGAIGMYELVPPFLSGILDDFAKKACADPKWFKTCKAILWCFGSFISTLMEDDVVPVAISNVPRLSVKQLTHSMDNTNRGEFRKYDYGVKKNIKIYGQKKPPAYNMTACTAPSAFFYGATDSLTVKADILATQKMLSNVILDYEVGPKFVHLDFIFAKNASHMVYKPTVKLFQDFDAGIVPEKVTRDTKSEREL